MAELEGRVALVTGSSRGIGWAVARALAAEGATVAVTGRSDPDAIEARAAELRDTYGVDAFGLCFDVGDPDGIRAALRTVFERVGRLDVTVANAGILGDALVGMISDELVTRTLAVNLAGTLHLLQASAKLMRRRRSGSIVLVSSIVGRMGNVGQLVYAASKAGVIGAGLAAAKELGPQGIRVNVIAPGVIDTDMIRHLPDAVVKERLGGVALGRLGRADEVAQAALFLASDRSSYVNGQVLGVDGAMVL
jgi:3-oxoacyl-[acyl-carrier protein] reductase